MAKDSKNGAKETKSGFPWRIAAIVGVAAVVIGLAIWWMAGEEPDPGETEPTTQTVQTDPDVQESTEPTEEIEEPTERDPASPDLGNGLQITSFGSYDGDFMEDGTNEEVSDVMSILLENTSDQDLQLAQIQIKFPSLTAQFQATNLPAGETMLLLEQNRAVHPDEEMEAIECENVVFFDEPMGLQSDKLQINGTAGSLEVTNISNGDLEGDIFIYYKNYISDMLYGGITYRVRIEGGLKSGETKQVPSGHYHPDGSRIMHVTGI